MVFVLLFLIGLVSYLIAGIVFTMFNKRGDKKARLYGVLVFILIFTLAVSIIYFIVADSKGFCC